MSIEKSLQSHLSLIARLPERTHVTDSKGDVDLYAAFERILKIMKISQKGDALKFMFVGNGGSASIASHMMIDYQKNGGIRSLSFNDFASLTCLTNDLGYKNVFAHHIIRHANKKDILVAISSSGESENIIEAVRAARNKKCFIITLSGFKHGNSLSKMGDINFYVPSMQYGMVEITHLTLLHSLLDLHMEIV